MALSFEELKAAFAKRAQGGGENSNTGFWDKFYPFYKMEFDEVATWRFLPDLDEENPLGFVVENKYHELIINGKKKRLACLEMFGEPCPCCERSRFYYNDVGDQAMGKAFWRKLDYIAAGFVVNSPFEYPVKADENPARLISIGPKLFKKIEAAVMSGDFDKAPYDLIDGCDFRIMKSRQGEYADYSNSEFARRSTAIPDNIMERLQLLDIKSYRYQKIEKEQMEASIEAFLTGKSFDEPGEKASSTGSPALDKALTEPKAVPTLAKAEDKAVEEVGAKAETTAPAASSRAAEILAKLRRQQPSS